MKILTAVAAISTAILLTLSGCATTGTPTTRKAGNASTSLHQAAMSVAHSNAQLATVLLSLSDLVNNPGENLRLQYDTYHAEVTKLDVLATEVINNAAEMQERGAAYFAQWDAELAKIQNEDIRTRSVDRKELVTARFDQVKATYAQTRSDFAPFVSDLKDIRTMLGADLTAGGLAAARNLANKADRDVIPLRQSLNRLESAFEALGVSLSPSTPVI